ncbi:MAG: FGGY-family carbohydrate kinase [Lachnospiraceae bacterium]
MAKYFMGIDTGTQGARLGIVDEKGNIICASEKGWSTSYPKPHWAEQEPEHWWASIEGVLKEIASQVTDEIKKNIVSICVDSTSSTVIPVLEDGTPLSHAVMWMDIRAKKENDEINATNHPVLEYSGGADSAEWFVPKMLWFKKNARDIYDRAYKFVDQLDWINYKLTGVWSSSICNMTCKGNYVRSLGGYDRSFFEAVGLEDFEDKMIMRVDNIGDVVGTIRPEIAQKYGLNPEIVVVQGSIDAHMGMFGLNAISEGKLAVTMGTSFVHLGIVNKKLDFKGIWGPYEDAILDGTWCVEGGQSSAAGLVNWFARTFNIDKITDENPFAFLANSLYETSPGADGLIALDFFQGNRTPYKDSYAKGAIYGLTMQHTWKHIYRAILEAVAFGTHNIISNFDEQGYTVNDIVACGGVTKNKPWIQMISDITGKKIIINRDSQAAVLGCCVVGAGATIYNGDFQKAADNMVEAMKIIEPDMEKHAEYQPIFEKYKELYESTKSLARI